MKNGGIQPIPKVVYLDSNMFFCPKCNKHVVNVVLR